MKKNKGIVLFMGVLLAVAVVAALLGLFSMFPRYNGAVCKVTGTYTSGAVKEMVFYKGHKKIATYLFNEQGTVVARKGRTPEGLFRQYYANGRVLSKDNYVKGALSGLREVYHDGGRIRVRETYKNGKLFGVRKIYSENGRLACQQLFSNGKLNGLSRLFDDRGRGVLDLSYRGGMLDGKMMLYGGGKTPVAFWTYDNGRLHGPAAIFYGEDLVLAKDMYVKGRLVSRKLYTKAQSCLFAQSAKKYPRGKRTVRKGDVAVVLNYPAKTQDTLLDRYEGKMRALGGFTYAAKGRVSGSFKAYYPNGKPLFLENYKNGLVANREVYGKNGELLYKETPRPSSGQAR